MKHYRTEHPPNGNNKFNLNLTIKHVWKKGYLQYKNKIFSKNEVVVSPVDIYRSEKIEIIHQ